MKPVTKRTHSFASWDAVLLASKSTRASHLLCAKLKAHIQVSDYTGKQIFEDVDGNVVMGALGGNSNDITRGLAKEIAKDVSKRLPK